MFYQYCLSLGCIELSGFIPKKLNVQMILSKRVTSEIIEMHTNQLCDPGLTDSTN